MASEREIVEAKLRALFIAEGSGFLRRAAEDIVAALRESRKADVETVRAAIRSLVPTGIAGATSEAAALAALSRLAGDE